MLIGTALSALNKLERRAGQKNVRSGSFPDYISSLVHFGDGSTLEFLDQETSRGVEVAKYRDASGNLELTLTIVQDLLVQPESVVKAIEPFKLVSLLRSPANDDLFVYANLSGDSEAVSEVFSKIVCAILPVLGCRPTSNFRVRLSPLAPDLEPMREGYQAIVDDQGSSAAEKERAARVITQLNKKRVEAGSRRKAFLSGLETIYGVQTVDL